MTPVEEDIQIALGTYLHTVWNECAIVFKQTTSMYRLGWKLREIGDRMVMSTTDPWSDGYRFLNEADKIIDKGLTLDYGALHSFRHAIRKVYGTENVIQEIHSYGCRLADGTVFLTYVEYPHLVSKEINEKRS